MSLPQAWLDNLIAFANKPDQNLGRAELGLRVFTDAALGRQRTGTALGGMRMPGSKPKKD